MTRCGRSHTVNITPVALFDLMFDADYVPPLRAAIPIGVKAALAGDGALLGAPDPRRRAGSRFSAPPRDFSTARYATVCETTPLPWDRARRSTSAERSRSSGSRRCPPTEFSPFDAQVVVEDEIDLCLHWPDVPRRHRARAAAVSAVPTLILQGGEDLRTPPEGSARVAARNPGRGPARRARHRALDGQRPARLRGHAIEDFINGSSCRAAGGFPTGVPAVLSPPPDFESLDGVSGYPRKVGRTLRALLATFHDLDLLFSPAALHRSGGGLRGGSWEIQGTRLDPEGLTRRSTA